MFSVILKFRAIESALRKPAPSSIPLSGPRAAKNDFYAIFVEFPKDDWKFLVTKAEKGGFSGKLYINEREGRECTILKSAIAHDDSQLLIQHYFRGRQFDYRNAFWYCVARTLHLHSIQILSNRFLQDIYNRKTLIRTERMELLRDLVEQAVANPTSKFHPLTLGAKLNSSRWFYHPQREEHQRHLKFVMNSLVATNDLTEKDGYYTVAPQAIATLANFELEERRHLDSINTSRTANRLSFFIFIVGILAIAVQLFIWFMGPRQ